MSLLVVGTVALDTVKTPAGMRKNILGGSAAHFCISARLFTPVALSGVVGHDFPKAHIRFLKKKKIDISCLQQKDGVSFRWKGEYKKNDMNTALTLNTELGVLTSFNPSLTERQRKTPYVFLANLDPDMQMFLLKLMRSPRLVGLDTMNLWIAHQKKSLIKLMKRVDLFVANDGEARALTGESNLIKAARLLRKMGPKIVVVKKGEHGVLCYSDRFMFALPAYPIESVIDPTGAGDTFAGGLMGYLAHTKKINEMAVKTALIYATTIASFNVQGFGIIKTANLTMPIVNKRMKAFVKFCRPT